MTKRIRIENADTAPYKVIVQVWERGARVSSDVLIKEIELPYPTAMTGDDIYITDTRFLVVKEA